jgi:glucose-6-phosphate dehydrogenase assembly protein OpcA
MASSVNPDLDQDVRVDIGAIEKSLSDLWRSNKSAGDEEAITRAALWNVVAHTGSDDVRAQASEILGRASAAVPQRTIVVRASPSSPPEIASWISANCHLVGGGKQVCSEEIAIVAGGDHIHRVPPLVSALLIPDMPVAFWWLGDLPNEHESYVERLLDCADRLIVDSVHFDSPADLVLLSRISASTTTEPADLNWVRLEEWRAATASIFDPPEMRERLHHIRRVRVLTATSAEKVYFGESIEALLYAGWMSGQVSHHVDDTGKVEGARGSIEYVFESRKQRQDAGCVISVEIGFEDGTRATISRDRDRGVLTAAMDGNVSSPDSVTRAGYHRLDDLIVRQLKRTEGDKVLVRVLPLATKLARRIVP